MRKSFTRFVRLAGLAALLGTCFQFGGCGADLLSYIGKFNPCGSILVCDSTTYKFVASGYKGPGADPSIDPACTFPPFCANDPFIGGGLLIP